MSILFVSALSSVRLRNRKVVTYSQERNVKWPVGPVPRLYSEREFLCLIPMAFLTAALDGAIFVGYFFYIRLLLLCDPLPKSA